MTPPEPRAGAAPTAAFGRMPACMPTRTTACVLVLAGLLLAVPTSSEAPASDGGRRVAAAPPAPELPTAYSARVRQEHRDAASGAVRTRWFAIYHDFPLRMQRVDHGSEPVALNGTAGAGAESLIQRYGRSWGDACGGARLLLEPFFNETRCYALSIPNTDCILSRDFPALSAHIPGDFRFVFAGKRATDAGALYTWTATEPPTACPNGAVISAFKTPPQAGMERGAAWRLAEFNVSQDCSWWHHRFLEFLPISPSPSVFQDPANITCRHISTGNGDGAGGEAGRKKGGEPAWKRMQGQVNAASHLRGVRAAISAEALPWAAGANARFDHVTFREAARLAGTRRRPPGDRGRLGPLQASLSPPPAEGLIPPAFDAREAWPTCNASISRVRDQGVCGCCWAMAAVESLADRLCIASAGTRAFDAPARRPSTTAPSAGAQVDELSPEYLLSCASKCDGCDGGYVDEAWRFLRDHGVCDERCTPYAQIEAPGGCPSRCASSTHGPAGKGAGTVMVLHTSVDAYTPGRDQSAIMRDIWSHGPVEATMWVYSDFMNYQGGIYSRSSKAELLGGHAVKIIGWGASAQGVKYWLVVNSWGTEWGEGGLFRIRRGTNECDIEDEVAAGHAPRAADVAAAAIDASVALSA